VPIGSALGYVLGGLVSHALGWRAAFFVAGGPGLLAGLACLAIDEPERRAEGGEERPAVLASLGTLARLPVYVWTVLGLCAFVFALGGFAVWAPKYVHARYGVEQGQASATFGMLLILGGALGTVIGGWLGDRGKHPADDDAATARHNVLICAVSSAVAAPLAAAAISAGTPGAFYAWLLPCEIALFVGSGPINIATLRSVPPALRASGMALSIFAMHAFGDLWSPPLIGLVADLASMKLAVCVCPAFFALGAMAWGRAARSQAAPTHERPLTVP
jgi:MFS family permease